MNLSEIENIADNWYNRTVKLSRLWRHYAEIKDNRAGKALRLWFIMYQRLNNVTQLLIKYSTPIPKYEKGTKEEEKTI